MGFFAEIAKKKCLNNSSRSRNTPENTSVSYKTGQLFLHKKLGYRGVILVPWKTKVLENNVSPTLPVRDGEETMDILCGDVDEPNHVSCPAELLYNVLVDSTDASYVRS